MSAELTGRKRRWVASTAGAAIVAMAMLALFRIKSPLPDGRTSGLKSMPPLELTRTGASDTALREEMIMNDQTSLFLPTARNVALPSVRRPEAGQSVLDQDVLKMAIKESELNLGLPAPVDIPSKAAEVLLTGPLATPLAGFGRVDASLASLPARGAFIEVRTVNANRPVFGDLLADAKPPAGKAWRPMEFLAAVDAAGLVGPLVITERSDAEDVDNYFRRYLTRTFRIGDRLTPGFYRVIVGP